MSKETTNRRIRLDLMESAEKAITSAIWEVEKMPADLRLTEAVILLGKARDLVSDFIDKVNEIDHDFHYYKCPDCGRLAVTSKESPKWIIDEITVLQIHWHRDMKLICRMPYLEITKEEFFKLSENPDNFPISEQIKPSV